MSKLKKCEAQELAIEGFADFEIPPCNGERELAFADRWLCRPCVEALRKIRELAEKIYENKHNRN